MPIFMIQCNFAEWLEVTPEGAATINRINDEEGVRWLISFLSADKKKTFCLYEATSAEAIREAAQRAGTHADVIIEVGQEIMPRSKVSRLEVGRFAAQDANKLTGVAVVGQARR